MNRRARGPDTSLAECPERSVGLVLADPISKRLDGLVDCVEATGERTSRKEVIAALILAASPDGEQLAASLRRLRLAGVRDVYVGLRVDPQPSANGGGLDMSAQRQPGPRARRGRR